jgi:hypothetical protein
MKKKMEKHIILLVFLFTTRLTMASGWEDKIKQFIEFELSHYPKAQLTDLYKNYFQDAYGPGHLIHDTTGAGAYLDREMQDTEWTDTLIWQALGIHNDYYRVNLILVKKGILPRDTLLLGMVESASLARKPDIKSWKEEWAGVLAVIKELHPELPRLAEDEKLIDETLSNGNVVMHHSKTYEEEYNPHYRIIHRTVFNRWRKSYLRYF